METAKNTMTLVEINSYIARNVMFWHILEADLLEEREPETVFYHNESGISAGVNGSWNPWQNIEDAMWILERRLKPPTYCWSIYRNTDGVYQFHLIDNGVQDMIYRHGLSIPQLICISALENYGLWPKKGIKVIE